MAQRTNQDFDANSFGLIMRNIHNQKYLKSNLFKIATALPSIQSFEKIIARTDWI